MIKIKRVYEAASSKDGYRVLVDRLWPRGIKKAELKFDEWPKEVCPSHVLRKEFGHKPDKFSEFKNRYKKELRSSAEAQNKLAELAERSRMQTVTLLYAARDEKINHAQVLREVLDKL